MRCSQDSGGATRSRYEVRYNELIGSKIEAEVLVSLATMYPAIHLQYIYSTFTVYLQYIYGTFTVHLQYIYSTFHFTRRNNSAQWRPLSQLPYLTTKVSIIAFYSLI